MSQWLYLSSDGILRSTGFLGGRDFGWQNLRLTGFCDRRDFIWRDFGIDGILRPTGFYLTGFWARDFEPTGFRATGLWDRAIFFINHSYSSKMTISFLSLSDSSISQGFSTFFKFWSGWSHISSTLGKILWHSRPSFKQSDLPWAIIRGWAIISQNNFRLGHNLSWAIIRVWALNWHFTVFRNG